MKMKKIVKGINLANDMLNVFDSYCCNLSEYFKNEDNQKNNSYLYQEFLNLDQNLKNALKKNGFDKK